MTAIEFMPAPALACMRLVQCRVCDYPRYVPAAWPVEVCPECVGNPAHREQFEFIFEQAVNRIAAAEQDMRDAYAAAPEPTRQVWDRLHAERADVDAGTLSKADFMQHWQQAQASDGLSAIYEAWKVRTATLNACTRTMDAVQPRLDAILDALKTLEHQQ